MKTTLKTVALAGLLGTGLVLAGTTSASAAYTKTSCDGGLCRTIECNDFGEHCVTLRYFRGDRYSYRRYYDNSSYYDYDTYPTYRESRHMVCDSDGDNCQMVYD